MRQDAEAPPRRLGLVGLGIVLLAACVALLRTEPPAPKPSTAAAGEFSAIRAASVLSDVLGPGTPHPTGSAENRAVRDRIVRRLSELGWSTAVEPTVVCGRYGVCAALDDVVARRAGRTDAPALLLAAHYDSVAAGPGASDDGAGVATLLEVARALAAGPPLERPVMLLFDDGEEAGLLGAEAFVKKHDVGREIGAVVNVEARGTTGPSLMFETSDGNANLVAAFARASPRPVTGSLFYAVYRHLPNDTDFTVFKRAGLAGLNLAPIGGVARYHTPLDDLAHLDRGTLQQHGDSTLGLARELARSLPLADATDAVFFDVFALGVVRWPLAATRLVSAGFVGLALGLLGFALRARRITLLGLLRRAWWWPLPRLLAALLAYGLFRLLTDRLPAPWPAHPGPALGLVALAAVVPELGSALLARKLDAWTEWATGLVWWSVLALVVAWFEPAASYLVLAPLALAAVVGWVGVSAPRSVRAAFALAALGLGAFALWLPVLRLAYDALGLQAPALLALAASILFGTLAPIVAFASRRALRGGLLAAVVLAGACFAGARFAPPFSAETPERLSLALHWDADSHRARWLVDASGPVPESLLSAGGFSRQIVEPTPWLGGWRPRALEAPGPAVELAAPSFELEESHEQGGERSVRAKLRSNRGARSITLFVPRGTVVSALTLAGQNATLRYGEHWASATFLGLPEDGVEVELSVSGHASLLVADHTPGLPEIAASLLRARPASAVPSQLGDVSVASRRIEL